MSTIIEIVAAAIALVGGLILFVALFTPKRYTSKRPSRFILGWSLLGLSLFLYAVANGAIG